MLVITRKVGEAVQLGGDVRLVVVSLRGERVRLGLQAPPGVSIRRGEIPPREPPERGTG